MSKDPAFLFYPNDWLGETMGMTFEQKGAYLELLMLQFNRGHMPLPLIHQVVGALWEAVKEHFEADEEGRYYNLRLEEEVQRRRTYCASRRKNIQGVNQFSERGGHMGGHMTSHMETAIGTGTGTEAEAGTEAESVSKAQSAADTGVPRLKAVPARFVPPTPQEVAAYCAQRGSGINPQRFVDFYASKGWLVGRSPMKDWKAAIRSWEASESAGRASPAPQAMTGKYSEVI